MFKSTAEVMQSNPLPKRLMIINAEYSDIPQEAQESGEVIDVSHVERHGQLRVYMIVQLQIRGFRFLPIIILRLTVIMVTSL